MQISDLCDQYPDHIHVASPIFNAYGRNTAFYGEISTVNVFEDNVLVKHMLASPGKGKVLVVDGGGSMRCALMGDQVASLAIENEWAGVIIHGCIRDSAQINTLPIGVRAMATHPVKSKKSGKGTCNQEVSFADITFRPGEYCYVDEDGIIVSKKNLLS